MSSGKNKQERPAVSIRRTHSVTPPLQSWDTLRRMTGRGGGEERLSALERKFEVLEPSLMRALEKHLQDWCHSPETRQRKTTTVEGNATQI